MSPGDRLKYWRIENNIKAVTVAEKTGVTQAAISTYESNKSKMGSEFIIALHNNFDINIYWLLFGTEIEIEKGKLSEDELKLIQDYRLCSISNKKALALAAEAYSKFDHQESLSSKIG